MTLAARPDDPAEPVSGLDGLAPVARTTVQDTVHAELRRSLIRGAFDAGEVLRIRDIAARMAISTMPVREALARLVSECALEALPNRSVRVPPIRRAHLEDLARARALIEGELVALALPRLDATDRARLIALTVAYDRLAAGRIVAGSEAAELNHAFHFTIYRAAGSEVLIPMVESLWLQSGPYIRAAAELFDPVDAAHATRHHHELIAAIAAADAAAARRALVADVNFAFDVLRREGVDG